MHSYYIDNNGQKDGPHDLVTIMRRIRAGKIGRDTLIYVGTSEDALPAGRIDEIALFFDNVPIEEKHTRPSYERSLDDLVRIGWQFLAEHHIITVYAGGMLLLSMMLAMSLINSLGWVMGGMAAWAVFLIFHNLYFVFMLRYYRGQTLGSDFINENLSPILLTLLVTSIALALMMAGGLMLLIVPGVIVSVMYIFSPFLILDRRYGVAESMYGSRLLLQKRGRKYVKLISMLVFCHVLCLLLIIPIPITLPIFAAALAELYEEMIAA